MRTPITTVHINRDGLEMFLGSLEASIMVALWDGVLTRGAIHLYIVRNYKETAYTTVITVINRLIEKGLIVIDRSHGNNTLKPRYPTEDDFIEACVTDMLNKLREEFNDTYQLIVKDDSDATA